MPGVVIDLPPGYADPRHIGSGGWADVYRCVDQAGHEEVAVKLFHQPLPDPVRGAERFHQECQTAAALSTHPGVIRVRAAGITASGRPWLAMDLAARTLTEAMRESGGNLPLQVALDMTTRLADTLAWAHALGSPVVHGDIKAANVLLDGSGRPLLSDFGVATHLGTRQSVTVTQFTPTHAAPEVLTDGRASVSSDIWGLVATLYEMLTGAPPFVSRPGEGPGTFIRRVEEGLPLDAIPASIPPPVAAIIRAGLTVDRKRRTANMADLASALRSAQQRLGGPVTPPWPPTAHGAIGELRFVSYDETLGRTIFRPHRSEQTQTVAAGPRRRWRLVTAAAGATLVAVLVGAVLVVLDRPTGPASAGDRPSTSPAMANGAPVLNTSGSSNSTPAPWSSTGKQPVDPSTHGAATAKPGTVTAFTVLDHQGTAGLDGRLSFSLTAPSSPVAITRYEFDYTGDGAADAWSTVVDGYLTGLTNGTQYVVRVRACADQNCGDWSAASPTQQPYGPVPQPGAGASKSGSTQINLSWSAGGTNGRPLARLEIRVDGGGWENVGTADGNRVVGSGYNQTHSVEVRAIDTAGQVSVSAYAAATTDPPPPPCYRDNHGQFPTFYSQANLQGQSVTYSLSPGEDKFFVLPGGIQGNLGSFADPYSAFHIVTYHGINHDGNLAHWDATNYGPLPDIDGYKRTDSVEIYFRGC
jgi:serine/threonine protein kinase